MTNTNRTRLLILGGTGKTGLEIVKEAIKQGYVVNVLARTPDKLQQAGLVENEFLTVFLGTPENYEDIKKAIQGASAVLSALNISREGRNPFSKLVSPKDLITTSLDNTIKAMDEEGINRIIAVGIAPFGGIIKVIFGIMGSISNFKYASREHKKQEEILQNSDLNYTIARAVILTNDQETKPVHVSYDNEPKSSINISRHSLGKFMVESINDPTYYKKMPIVSQL